jgi:hypothetical protein
VKALSDADIARMPWHARQRYIVAVSESAAYEAELIARKARTAADRARIRASAEDFTRREAVRAVRDAKDVLATLETDPLARLHMETLERELRHFDHYRRGVA